MDLEFIKAMEYYNKNKFAYLPKKPVKTFQDLDVYRLALEANVFVVNFIVPLPNVPLPKLSRPSGSKFRKRKDAISGQGQASMSDNFGIGTVIIDTLTNCACLIPHLIAEAHSFRFGSQKECLILLERVMLNCNKMVVYLDQARDICQTGLEVAKFEELQKKYLLIRRKVLNLQRSWQKYINMPRDEKIFKDIKI